MNATFAYAKCSDSALDRVHALLIEPIGVNTFFGSWIASVEKTHHILLPPPLLLLRLNTASIQSDRKDILVYEVVDDKRHK